MSDVPRPATDASAKARIRDAALRLYAAKGQATSLREVAREACVAPGLVAHHYGGKEGLREAVEEHVVDRIRESLETVPLQGSAAQIGRRRDAAVAALLRDDAVLAAYVGREYLAQGGEGRLIERFVDLSLEQVRSVRAHGVGNPEVDEGRQAVAVLVRQFAHVLLEPVVARMWETVGSPGDEPPGIEVRLR